MGALTSNRKRLDDYFKSAVPISSPIGHQSYGHIPKKPKLSDSMCQNTPECARPTSFSSFARRLSSYPEAKPELSRVHAPVRDRRFRFFSWGKKTEAGESSADRMGNVLGIEQKYAETRNIAFNSLRYFRKDDEAFISKEKETEVFAINDSEEEKQDDFPDDSSIEEVDIVELKDWRRTVESSRDLKGKMVDNQLRSLDSSVVLDVNNANGKVDDVDTMRDLMLLDREHDGSGLQSYQRLYNDTKKRDGKLNSLKYYIELSEKCIKGLRSQFKRKQVKKDWAEECFMPLTKEEEEEVARALHYSSRRKVLVTHENSNVDINGEKLQCLSPGAWLNDEVINLYLELLKEREKREPEKFLKCHFFNTFFYKKLISRDGYKSVRRWSSQRKLGYSLFECDKIFIPIHQHIHWCLAIINKKEEKFQYLDSLRGVDHQVLNVLARYYVDEVKDKNGEDIDVSSWEQEFVTDLPEQENGYDCGVFMIKYVDFYSRDIGLCFSQEHMPYFRKRTAKEILKLRAD